MKWDPQVCPECGKEPEGAIEVVHGLAALQPDGDGGYQYAGETKMFWGEQQTVTDPMNDRKELLFCGSHEWFAEVLEE